jgi:GNAT superfamily N-acetyltransferase
VRPPFGAWAFRGREERRSGGSSSRATERVPAHETSTNAPFQAATRVTSVMISYRWRGDFDSTELNELHAEAFETRVYDETEWNWLELVHEHSLGWVVARDDARLVGFVNVPWDGLVHAWVQDTMVATAARHQGVGTKLVAVAVTEARSAGCEWMHVDFDDQLRPFYFDACGFTRTNAGLIAL